MVGVLDLDQVAVWDDSLHAAGLFGGQYEALLGVQQADRGEQDEGGAPYLRVPLVQREAGELLAVAPDGVPVRQRMPLDVLLVHVPGKVALQALVPAVPDQMGRLLTCST